MALVELRQAPAGKLDFAHLARTRGVCTPR